MKSTKSLAFGAITAALYVALTLLSAAMGLHVGIFEFRFSEALTILPAFFPAAIPGLTVGCFLSTLITAGTPWDLFLGSFATLLGGIATYLLRHTRFWVYLPPIVANTLIIPPVLYYSYGLQQVGLPLLFVTFALGECVNAGLFAYLFRKGFTPFWKRFK